MSGGSDIAITPAGANLPQVKQSVKPNWLIYLQDSNGKASKTSFFISLDRPDISNNGVVFVKGIFSKNTEDEILSSYQELLTSTAKDLYCEVLIPHHRIIQMRSLVFRQK